MADEEIEQMDDSNVYPLTALETAALVVTPNATMRDPITIQRVQLIHPKIRQDVINFIEEVEAHFNFTFRMAQGYRTFAEQDALYALGRTKPGKVVTNSKGGQSYHNYSLASDQLPMINGVIQWSFDFSKLVPFATKYGLYWGGNFHDMDHFENRLGYNWRDLLAKHNAKDFIPNTIFLNI